MAKDGCVSRYLSLRKPFPAHGEDSLLLLTQFAELCPFHPPRYFTAHGVCTSSHPEQRCPSLAGGSADDLVLLRFPGADGCSWSGRVAGVFGGAVECEGGRCGEQNVEG